MSETSTDPRQHMNYWRSLQELADTEEYRNQLENEFPSGIDIPTDGMSRRRFLQVMSASVAMVSLAGCRWPEEKIVPYVDRPDGATPGRPLQFATTMELGPVALGVLATSYDGRPIKIDGNPDFKLSLGATSAFAQASVLDVYDADRSQHVLKGGRKSDMDAFSAFASDHFGQNLQGVAILTGATTSPSTWGLMMQAKQRGAGVFLHEPVCRINEMRGAMKAFGRPAKTHLDLREAQVIVDFDSNFMQDHPTALRNSKEFAAARQPEEGRMNRLYVYENTYSITGGMADHRFPTAARDIGPAVWAVAAELVMGLGLPLPANAGITRGDLSRWRNHPAGGEHIKAVAHDLMEHRGKGLLVAGLRQDPDVHALIHVLNTALGNVGHGVDHETMEMPQVGMVDELVDLLNAGRVTTLVVLDGNPVYDTPVDIEFAAAMGKARTRIHLGHQADATAAASNWHVPRAHYLESWGDATAFDGTHMAVQPLIAPLYGGISANELLSMIVDETPRTGYEIARATFATRIEVGEVPENDPAFEKKWRTFIHDGLLKGSAKFYRGERGGRPGLAGARLEQPGTGGELSADNLEITFLHDQSMYDGRFADNAWLQEMPDFMSKLTWDNAAIVGPATADALDVKHGDVVTLDYEGRTLDMPVYVLPGQAAWSVTVHLGYGRKDAGRVGQDVGFDTYTLRTAKGLHRGEGLKVTRTGRTYTLATTQDHHAIDTAGAEEIQKRVPALVREGNIEDYKADPEFVDHLGVHSPPLESLWKEWEYDGYKWGMAIDLNACNGCNACVIGCQSENNIPVVGKDEVSRGREMSWVRLDRYFLGDAEDPKVAQQPVACVQCENAPCEQVCPVAATLHTDEGLNAMVYNRCVGTRYCSNNCPYKVRRFNWFNNFEDMTQTQRLVLNPDVTVRSRGVMEKCSYCVQRIETARVDARVEGRKIMDGDITPACAATCPTDAITFGDLNDSESRVSKLREATRSYDLLNYLNVKPRTFYMARIRNPHPAIEPARQHGGHGGHGDGHDGGHDEDHGAHEEKAHG